MWTADQCSAWVPDQVRFSRTLLAAGFLFGMGFAAESAPRLQPHVAVYDLTLAAADDKSGISGVDGRLVYEVDGSVCEGFTVNYRFVTRMSDNDGGVRVTDMRVNNYEESDGSQFTFLAQFFVDNNLAEETRGAAHKEGEGIVVNLAKPEKKKVSFKGGIIFPTQQTIKILEAARAGQKTFFSDIYDGSDEGEKTYASSAVIGAPIAPGDAVTQNQSLKGLSTAQQRRWPVEIAYFERDAGGDATPDYVISFDLFEDGVSWHPVFDYGDFTLEGHLKTLELRKQPNC